jgi:tRNA U38,U39,U40 pseudouridine synthase TruA
MRWGQRTLQHQRIEDAACAARTIKGISAAQMLIHLPSRHENG